MKKFMLLHGVNHNMFGKRNPEQYGTVTLDEINENVQRLARELGVSVTCFQTNDEGKMVDKIHEAYTEHYDGVMINAGAWTHYSYGISDALEMLECPLIELHMSNIHKREEFRHHSVISPIATGIIGRPGSRRIHPWPAGPCGPHPGTGAEITDRAAARRQNGDYYE